MVAFRLLLAAFLSLVLAADSDARRIWGGGGHYRSPHDRESDAITETFYLRANGDGAAPETVAGAFDAADFNTSGNWASVTADDGKIGPGDTVIVLDDDGPIRAALDPQASGTAARPILIQGESGGTARITGSNFATSFSLEGSGCGGACSNTYVAAVTTDPGRYVRDATADAILALQTSIQDVEDNEGSFFWASNALYVHITGGGAPGNTRIESPIRNNAWAGGHNSYLTLDNLTFDLTVQIGLVVDRSHGFFLRNSTVRYTNWQGLWVWDGDAEKTNGQKIINNTFIGCGNDEGFRCLFLWGDDLVIRGNTFDHVLSSVFLQDVQPRSLRFVIEENYFTFGGYSLFGDAEAVDTDIVIFGHNGMIKYNEHRNSHNRVISATGSGNVVAYNLVADATSDPDTGVCIDTTGAANLIANNTCVNTANIAFLQDCYLSECEGNAACSAAGNPMACCTGLGAGTCDVVDEYRNNIAAGTGVQGMAVSQDVVDTGEPRVLSHNRYFGSLAFWCWGATCTGTYATWAGLSGETDSGVTDPSFVGGTDYHLQSSSALRNLGTDVGLTRDLDGTAVPQESAPEPGCYEIVP